MLSAEVLTEVVETVPFDLYNSNKYRTKITPSILSFFVLFSSLSFCGYPLYWGETHSLSEPHLY